jgi:hypothetical protein
MTMFHLIAYKPYSYYSCSHGCCPREHYDSNLIISRSLSATEALAEATSLFSRELDRCEDGYEITLIPLYADAETEDSYENEAESILQDARVAAEANQKALEAQRVQRLEAERQREADVKERADRALFESLSAKYGVKNG